MKFTTLALIQIHPDIINDVRTSLPMLSSVYVSDSMITLAKELLGGELGDLSNEDLAFAISEINGTKAGVDEGGIYELLPAYKQKVIELNIPKIEKDLKKFNLFDSFAATDLLLTDELLKVIDSFDRFPDVIVTPNNEIIRSPKAFMYVDVGESEYEEFLHWKDEAKKVLEKHKDNSMVLLMDCHI